VWLVEVVLVGVVPVWLVGAVTWLVELAVVEWLVDRVVVVPECVAGPWPACVVAEWPLVPVVGPA
jgi:hypothetical protein